MMVDECEHCGRDIPIAPGFRNIMLSHVCVGGLPTRVSIHGRECEGRIGVDRQEAIMGEDDMWLLPADPVAPVLPPGWCELCIDCDRPCTYCREGWRLDR